MISLSESLIRKNREVDVIGVKIEEIKNFIINNYTFQIDNRDYIPGENLLEFLEIKLVGNEFIVNNIHNKYISIFLNQEAQSISDNLFTWGNIHGDFICFNNKNLKSLEGSPKICDDFCCANCRNLKSLEGAPEQCADFNCKCCLELKTLKGAPNSCTDFNCTYCYNLKTLEGITQYIKRDIICTDCEKLISLKGCPKSIGGDLNIAGCRNLKTLKDSPKVKYIIIDNENDIDDYNGLEDKITWYID